MRIFGYFSFPRGHDKAFYTSHKSSLHYLSGLAIQCLLNDCIVVIFNWLWNTTINIVHGPIKQKLG
jgi:hypothetical protein